MLDYDEANGDAVGREEETTRLPQLEFAKTCLAGQQVFGT